ncbi:unnamed protein product [Brassica oleracea]
MLPMVSCEFLGMLGMGEPVIPGIGGKEISWLGGNPSNISNEVMRLGLFWLGIRGMGEVSQVR